MIDTAKAAAITKKVDLSIKLNIIPHLTPSTRHTLWARVELHDGHLGLCSKILAKTCYTLS